MATVATTPRTNQITLANTSAGPFLVGFRLFASDGLDVYLNGVRQTSGFTVAATFVDGYDDNASVTFAAAQPPGTVIQFDGALIPGRAADYFNPDPTLTAKLNIELARLWSSVSEINQLVRRSVRGLDAIEAVDGINPADLANLPANLAAAAAAATTATGAALTATTARDQVLAVQDSLPEWRGPWVTARVYGLGDLVSQAGSSYICIVAHTSGTFSTDLANGRWQLFAQQGAAGAGTGDMLAANNLSDVANTATARANIGAQSSNALLSAIAALAGNGLMGRTGAGTAVARTITAGSGIQVANGDGVSGNPTVAVTGNLSSLAGLSLAAGDVFYATGANTVARLPIGTATQILRVNAGATAPEWGSGSITLGTAVASTSGVNVDFTGIPASARRVRAILSGVSWNATAALRFQLGDSGGFETTGYTGTSSTQNASSNTFAAASAGFETTTTVLAGDTISGAVTFTNITGNVWVADGVFAVAGGQTLTVVLAGTKTLSDVLDRVRVTSAAGATFDAGTVNVAWE